MGLAKGTQPLPFGHSADAAVDIEGLSVSDFSTCPFTHTLTVITQLLEDHLQKLRDKDGEVDTEDNDEAAWQGWDVESDSSEESEEEGWMDVDSGGEDNLEISDSEDEQDKAADDKVPVEQSAEEPSDPNRISTLATTKVSSGLVKIDHRFLSDMHDPDLNACGLRPSQ